MDNWVSGPTQGGEEDDGAVDWEDGGEVEFWQGPAGTWTFHWASTNVAVVGGEYEGSAQVQIRQTRPGEEQSDTLRQIL